ncbi:MAG: helix-turn-helix domain-containing protein [Candidatus Eremiobacteraeota bacterium]|nr:helix-turn-helix domain-containing protein [Candidatus Eremiobacteraeota bacterium]
MTQFDTIRHWHEQGMSRREMARRLHVDVKTVRRQLRKMAAGATQPQRSSPMNVAFMVELSRCPRVKLCVKLRVAARDRRGRERRLPAQQRTESRLKIA